MTNHTMPGLLVGDFRWKVVKNMTPIYKIPKYVDQENVSVNSPVNIRLGINSNMLSEYLEDGEHQERFDIYKSKHDKFKLLVTADKYGLFDDHLDCCHYVTKNVFKLPPNIIR